MHRSIGILILAAGTGERFRAAGGKGNKLLARYPDATGQDQPLLALTLGKAVASGLPVHLVTRPGQREILSLVQRFKVSSTTVDSHGSGETIAAGVKATPDWQGWLIVPGDMGWIEAEDYQRVANAITGSESQVRLIADGKPGHPVGFGSEYRVPLENLNGDQGARSLLRPDRLQRIEADARVLKDADLPT